MVEQAADQRAEHACQRAEQNRVCLTGAAKGQPAVCEKNEHDEHESAQSDQPHLFGHEQIDGGDADVQVDVGYAGEANAKPGIARNQVQRVFVLTKTHQRRLILAEKAFNQMLRVRLGERQRRQQTKAKQGSQCGAGQRDERGHDGRETPGQPHEDQKYHRHRRAQQ